MNPWSTLRNSHIPSTSKAYGLLRQRLSSWDPLLKVPWRSDYLASHSYPPLSSQPL